MYNLQKHPSPLCLVILQLFLLNFYCCRTIFLAHKMIWICFMIFITHTDQMPKMKYKFTKSARGCYASPAMIIMRPQIYYPWCFLYTLSTMLISFPSHNAVQDWPIEVDLENVWRHKYKTSASTTIAYARLPLLACISIVCPGLECHKTFKLMNTGQACSILRGSFYKKKVHF